MISQSLSGNWQFRQVGSELWLKASVPGGVHTDLLDSCLIPDPFIGENEVEVQWVAEKDWEYVLTFIPRQELVTQEKIYLAADGLDTIAEVSLNGTVLGKANNQFRFWNWEISDTLMEGENILEVHFEGPAKFVGREQVQRRMIGVSQAIDGAPHMRKAPCHFGWDWGPKLPAIGIWKDIRLEGYSIANILDTHIRQIHNSSSVKILADITIKRWQEIDLKALLSIKSPRGDEWNKTIDFNKTQTAIEVEIESPELWWPNGYGDQPLYDIEIAIVNGDKTLDSKFYKIGLRTIALVQEEDEYGESFQFVVNDVPIFAKGSNWIPADSFINRFDDLRLAKLIADAAASHQNMLRVWGGGLFEEERLYDLCDKYGILVWQDFIFSCAIYPLDQKDFLANVQVEVTENIKRLRHRACLALWCGNNEMEWGWESWGWQEHPLEDQLPLQNLVEQFPDLRYLLDMVRERDLLPDWKQLKEAYDDFFHSTLPNWVESIDPDTDYWPSSPSSNTPFRDANGEHKGDAHFWDVWHGRKPFTAYRGSYPRFMSEFGFQAFPTLETIKFYALPEDRNLTSAVMEHHQRGNHGNGLIISQMTDTFRMPRNFVGWIYLSMVLQAEGIRYGVEHWRRNMHRVSGTLYWQLNDCWPVASWSSIDYFGRWKALHYAAKRFYAPLLLSIIDEPPIMEVHVTSDRLETENCTILWSLESIMGDVIESGSYEIKVKPLSDNVINTFDFGNKVNLHNKRDIIFTCHLQQNGANVSSAIGTFVPSKHLRLEEPNLKVEISEINDLLSISISTESLSRFIELKLDGEDVVFSDNYFDLPAGKNYVVTCQKPRGLSIKQAEIALKVYSLYDSF